MDGVRLLKALFTMKTAFCLCTSFASGNASRQSHQGKERSDIKPGYLSIQAEKHNIYYRITDARIEIIAVLHHSMEPRLHL